jgi:uncharacterized protein (TIGR02266 family)
MSETPVDERRQHPRLPFILRVDYRDITRYADSTENVSAGGVFIRTEQKFSIGDKLTITLSFPQLLDPLEVTGQVIWIRSARGDLQGGVGIRVDQEADRKRLGELVNSGGAESRGVDTSALPREGFRVLIVEDNPHIIEMYSYVLKKLATGTLGGKVPLEVCFAPDGHSALAQLKEGAFNLVMTDLYMPVMDGFALVEKIRQEEKLKGIPVIAISAGGKEAQERALDLGVDIYLRKPVKFVEVLETVKQLLRIK